MWLEIYRIFRLNWRLEWQKRRSYFSLLIYVLATAYLSYLLFKGQMSAATWNGFFWVIFLFAAIQAAYRSFGYEAGSRYLLYAAWLKPEFLILGKILYNFLYLLFLGVLTALLLVFLLSQQIADPLAFVAVIFLAALGFSSVLTLTAGLSAKASQNPALPAILSIPLLYPQLVVLSRISLETLTGFSWELNRPFLLVLSMIALVALLMAYLLFPYLWRD